MLTPCKICKTTEHLKPKWLSDEQVMWVHCDKCGSVGSPGRDGKEAEANWVRENTPFTHGGVEHDMWTGPCMCGAWHKPEDFTNQGA